MRSKVRDYEYVESGLNNVLLKNITVHECAKCGELLPEIANVKQVHKWIAEYLVKKQSPLTGAEFRFLRKQMGMGAAELAGFLGVTPVTMSRWENGKETVGPQSDRLLRAFFVTGPRGLQVARAVEVFELLRAILPKIAHRKPKPERIIISLPEKSKG
ncbi:MAG: type II TA system antitoxin MqsA family protein, partial [Candidatus Binatia bacterium]